MSKKGLAKKEAKLIKKEIELRGELLNTDNATLYENAARKWVTAGNLKEAIKNYEFARELYSHLDHEFRHIDKNRAIEYHSNYLNCGRNAERLRKVRSGNWHGLEGVGAIISISAFLGGLFFISFSFTGNAIGTLTTSTRNIVGGSLIVIGLVAGFFYIKNRK